jgi:hypothetical protein
MAILALVYVYNGLAFAFAPYEKAVIVFARWSDGNLARSFPLATVAVIALRACTRRNGFAAQATSAVSVQFGELGHYGVGTGL